MKDSPKDLTFLLVRCGDFLTIPTEGGIGIPLIGLSIGVPPIGVIPNADSNAAATSANSFDLPVPGAPVSKTFF